MAGERADGASPDSAADPDLTRLIAARLHQPAAALLAPRFGRASAASIERWLAGDAGHLHRAGDLSAIPVASHRRLGGRPVVSLKRALRRLLHPVLETQAGVNGANARAVTFLLEQLAAQSRAIDELERRLEELRAERSH